MLSARDLAVGTEVTLIVGGVWVALFAREAKRAIFDAMRADELKRQHSDAPSPAGRDTLAAPEDTHA